MLLPVAKMFDVTTPSFHFAHERPRIKPDSYRNSDDCRPHRLSQANAIRTRSSAIIFQEAQTWPSPSSYNRPIEHSIQIPIRCGFVAVEFAQDSLPVRDVFVVAKNEVFQIEDDTRPESASGFTRHWDSLLLVTLAWILFKVFAEPALSLVVCSIKFGWKDFANSVWLWRRDPVARRGRAVAAFNVAAGFWRITVGALALIVAALTINGILIGAQGGEPFNAEDGLLAGLTIAIVMMCFLLSSVSTYVAILLAWLCKCRVWLDPTVADSRKKNVWPPVPTGSNQLSRVVTTSLILLALAVIFGSFVAMIPLMNGRGGPAPGPLVFVPVIGMFFGAVLILGGREKLLRSLAADMPHDCWFETIDFPFEIERRFEEDDADYLDPDMVF